jgi:cell wall-associated NlpC family hydrolase
MSYADVVNDMQTIQTRLAQLGLLKAPATSAAASAASAGSFASALDGASSTAAVSTSSVASADGGLVSPNGATGNDVVDAALAYKGVPYVLGGESKSGIDCSGLVQAAFGKLGVSVPRTVHEQKVLGERVDSLKDAKPGDLIVLNGGDHIAVYMGHDTVIHAPYPGRTVSVQKAWFTDKDITTIRRIVPATGDAAASPAASAASAVASLTSAAAASTTAGTPSGLSQSAAMKASAMLTTYGADVGLYDASSSSSDSSGGGTSSSGTSLSSLLASFGLTGTTGAPGASSSSSTSAQQIIAAPAAPLGAGAGPGVAGASAGVIVSAAIRWWIPAVRPARR